MRLIDADKLYKYIDDEIYTTDKYAEVEDILDIIAEFAEETPNRWIPCSERLPERDESVLAYHRDVAFDYQYVSWIDDYSGKWAGFCGSLSDEVLAWMPLPEGYKEKKGSDSE
jgi:hypothetical protein